jgi:hypothetical protein
VLEQDVDAGVFAGELDVIEQVGFRVTELSVDERRLAERMRYVRRWTDMTGSWGTNCASRAHLDGDDRVMGYELRVRRADGRVSRCGTHVGVRREAHVWQDMTGSWGMNCAPREHLDGDDRVMGYELRVRCADGRA